MAKLLTEPRIPKEITEPKKRTRKKKDPSVPSDVKYTVISENSKERVNVLLNLFKEDPLKARVKFFNAKNNYSFDRTVLFEKGEKDFEFCIFRVSFGISISNKIYSSQKKLYSISYKNGKFWYIDKVKGKIRPCSYPLLTNFISTAENGKFFDTKIHKYFIAKFPWIKTISEHPLKHKINLNTIKAKKLTSFKDINRHLLCVPNNIAQLVINSGVLDELVEREGGNPMGLWKEMLRHLDGVQNLTTEMLESSYFVDSCRMAKTLGRKVNCRWGDKRLKEEHDKWGREIGNIVLDCEPEYDLTIKKVFLRFAEYSGYRLLKTNKDMIIEGMTQDHCVGGYIDKVQRGTCAIYHVDGFTLQVGIADYDKNKDNERISYHSAPQNYINENYEKRVYNMQFKGKHNDDPPRDLITKVNTTLRKFCDEGGMKDLAEEPVEIITKASWAKANANDMGEVRRARNDEAIADLWDEDYPF